MALFQMRPADAVFPQTLQGVLGAAMITKRPNILQSYEHDLRALMDLYAAHDRQHPDKDGCGGVGSCLMMRTEVEAEQELERRLREMADEGIRLRLEVSP